MLTAIFVNFSKSIASALAVGPWVRKTAVRRFCLSPTKVPQPCITLMGRPMHLCAIAERVLASAGTGIRPPQNHLDFIIIDTDGHTTALSRK